MPSEHEQIINTSRVINRNPPANLSEEDIPLFRDFFRYRTFDSSVRRVGKARVSADSVAYKAGRLLTETLAEPKQAGYYRSRHLIKNLIRAQQVKLPLGHDHLLLTDAYSPGHYHWFSEIVPKLWCLRERANEFVLLLPNKPYLRTIGRESIELLGVKFADIVWMRDDEFYKVPNLYYVPRIAGPGQVDDGIMKQLNRKFVGDRPPPSKKLYVSRARASRRKVLNETELTALLREHGFEIVEAEGLTLRDQIELFAQCKTLIGIHGAGLTNCLFMPPGGNVVELRKREPNYAYWHLADSIGHRYYYYHGVPDSDASLIGAGCNLTVPLEDFERTILRQM